MITVKVYPEISSDLFLEIRFYLASIARKISFEVKDFLFIQLKREVYFHCDEAIFVYGFNKFFPEQVAKELVFKKLRENIDFPITVVDSACTNLGLKEQPDFYFEVMSKSAQHLSPFDDLRGIDASWNIQNNLVGSNITPNSIGDSFVEIIVSPSEIEFLVEIVWVLRKANLSGVSIWPKISLG